MVINGKIDAIKALREAASNATVERNDQSGRNEIRCGLGLKEAKDLVEAIEAYVLYRFVEDLMTTSGVARTILTQIQAARVVPPR